MKKLIENHKDVTKEPVTIEADGTIDGEIGKSFRAYIGNVLPDWYLYRFSRVPLLASLVAKKHLPITYDNWKSAPDELRELVWEETLVRIINC